MKISLLNLDHLFCINHKDKKYSLTLESYTVDQYNSNECKEGLLICNDCKTEYPIIDGIPIIIKNFIDYCSKRTVTFGKWFLDAKSERLKEFLKSISQKLEKNSISEKRYESEGLYFQSYKWLHNENFESDKFLHLMRWKIKPSNIYKKLTSNIAFNPEGVGLDLGCSLGMSTFELAKKFSFVFGIDTSFSFIKEARKKLKVQEITNVEFIVSDILNLPFKNQKFDLIFGLNVLEFVPINDLLKEVHDLLKPHSIFIITSPYDYNREIVYNGKIDGQMIRTLIEKKGFEISQKTKKESYIPWILKISERTYLFYFLDLIEARKISKHKY